MSQRPVIYVVAAALCDDGRVLMAERPKGKKMAGLWEFPGGKLERGESPEGALIRELEEELGVILKTQNLMPITFASHHYDDFQLFMPLYGAINWLGEPTALEGQALKWIEADRLNDLAMPAADYPLIKPLQNWLKLNT